MKFNRPPEPHEMFADIRIEVVATTLSGIIGGEINEVDCRATIEVKQNKDRAAEHVFHYL